MNLSKLDKSKSMFHEAAQKGKKLRGAELWEIEGGHQNLTRSLNGSEETLMPKKDFRCMNEQELIYNVEDYDDEKDVEECDEDEVDP